MNYVVAVRQAPQLFVCSEEDVAKQNAQIVAGPFPFETADRVIGVLQRNSVISREDLIVIGINALMEKAKASNVDNE